MNQHEDTIFEMMNRLEASHAPEHAQRTALRSANDTRNENGHQQEVIGRLAKSGALNRLDTAGEKLVRNVDQGYSLCQSERTQLCPPVQSLCQGRDSKACDTLLRMCEIAPIHAASSSCIDAQANFCDASLEICSGRTDGVCTLIHKICGKPENRKS